MKMLDIIKKIKRKSISILRNDLWLFGIGAFVRKFKERPLPVNQDRKVLIHIGCGDFNDPKYINVDSRTGWHIHRVGSIENCAELFDEEYADLIYACHVLEHVSHQRLIKTVKGLYLCLKKGGVLRLSVPDFDVIVSMYQERKNVGDIIEPLMGGQGYADNFHRSVFNEDYLRQILLKSGFNEVRRWNSENATHHNFNDWSKRKFPLHDRKWPISLNLEAVK
ncbi:MAG: methyltransferase domain-containing protein [Deltaproteobacteria bacterium]|nr:methyltransferase domain-containing protein [Deltaproteobacteria bacterium]